MKLFCSPTEAEKLREAAIPGLFVWRNNLGAIGETSAVAAGQKLLGKDITQPPQKLIAPYGANSKLREYQASGVLTLQAFLRQCGGGLIADDMGLGKTRQAIWAANGFIGRKLVVCPAAVRLTWQRELAKANITSVVIDPVLHSKLKKGNKLHTSDWTITSYDLAEKVYPFIFSNSPPMVLIMDEAHNLAGRGRDRKGNKRTAGIKAIAIQTPYKIAITGTPIWDSPRDLWMVLEILLGGAFGRAWDFDIRYCAGQINKWGGMDNHGVSNADELAFRLAYYMIRRTKQDVAAELPVCQDVVEWLDPDPKATQAWHNSMLKPNGSTLSLALDACLGAKDDRAVELACQLRRFILFTYHRTDAERFARLIADAGTPCAFIHGGLSHKARQATIDKCAADRHGLVATLDSAGVGVDGMQYVASDGIFHAFPWNPRKILQARARLDRIGQTLPVTWTYLALRESADESIIRANVDKLDHWIKVFGQEKDSTTLRNAVDDERDADLEKQLMREIYDSLA